MHNFLISSDIDGTLIDHHNYSFDAALPALERCQSLGVPIILNTSKTYQETLTIQEKLGIKAPIIVENGSALFFPKALDINSDDSVINNSLIDNTHSATEVKVFGVERLKVLDFIQSIRKSKKWQLEGFNDWSAQDIAKKTGLSLEAAEQASLKLFSEPFIWHDTEAALSEFILLARHKNLKVLKGGRFYHLQGDTDKAKPLNWLMQNLHKMFKLEPKRNIKSTTRLICLGDSHNDIAMLNIADIPICVRSPVTDYPSLSTDKGIIYTNSFGPAGWCESILTILQNEEQQQLKR